MIVFLFPGQNSRYPGMIARFATLRPQCAALLERASETLHRNLAAHFDPANSSQFDHNRDVQLGVFLASHMMLAALHAEGLSAPLSLGLSLGEYNHLVHIGALDFDSALRLLVARGDAYDTSPPGAMASIAPLPLSELAPVAASVGAAVALCNTPTQNVISGTRPAIDAALHILDDQHFVQGVLIDQRLPMHSPLFDNVATLFRPALAAAPWQTPLLPYLPNCRGSFLPNPSPSDFVDCLSRHLHQPVLWRQSVESAAAAAGPSPLFVEVGPRGVLSSMLGRRWLDLQRFRTDHDDHLQSRFDFTVQEILRLG